MRVCVVTEHRFYQTPDSSIWTDGPFGRTFWDRYLTAFNEVRVIARVLPVTVAAPGWVRADGDQISFAPVPYYIGPYQFLWKRSAVRQAVCAAVEAQDAVILRVPSTLAMLLFLKLRQTRHLYAVEAIGDPYDVYSPGALRHPFRPYFRWRFTREMQRHCWHAIAVSYVTSEALQRRYPPGPVTQAFVFSDVQIDDPRIPSPRSYRVKDAWTLITVGSLAHLYKSQDVQIAALAKCRQKGLNVRLVIVGDGKYRMVLARQAARLGVSQFVEFSKQLPAGAAINQALDHADVFVLPSRQEGLPRALIEAMSRALPCIGSHVGGIPELLPAEDRVPSGDAAALADKICEVITNPQRMELMSARNLERSQDFAEEVLNSRRREFYRYVCDHAMGLSSKEIAGSSAS